MSDSLDRDGAELFRAIVGPSTLGDIIPAFDRRRSGRAGARNFADEPRIAALVGDGALGDLARRLLGEAARPVRIILFDKSPDANWGVPWHQDRTIAVEARHEVPGFENWNLKAGVVHVEPPTDLLSRMLTLRVFVDDCDETNGPLEIALGSHKLGRVPSSEAAKLADRHPPFVALGSAGDVLGMSLLALHRSRPAERPGHRRVVHVDYAAVDLPEPLRWALPI